MGERYKHAVDTAYTMFVKQKLIEGIIQAQKQLVKARLGIGWGHSNANINRRAVDVNGKAFLGMNPDGIVDKKIGLIKIDKEDGSPLVLIANYAIHGTALGASNLKISADVPGIVSEYVEEKTGVPLVFVNGAAGNIAPIYSTYPDKYSAHLSQYQVLLGDKILEASKSITTNIGTVQLFAGKQIIETPKKENIGWPTVLQKYISNTGNKNNTIQLPVRFLKINNDIAIWSLPVELFCEISNDIRDKSPYPYTFYFGYTNGWLGYLPTANEFRYGGYEVEVVNPYTTAAEKDVKDAVLDYLQGNLKSKIVADRISVNNPLMVEADEYNTLVLLAENGKAIGEDIKYMPEWKAFGWFQYNDKVEWELNIREEKEYIVLMEWSVANEHSGQPFIVETNAASIMGNVAKSGSWETYTSAPIGKLKLKAGKQKIIFKAGKNADTKKALLDLRKLMLVPID
jgi:hypothetical protein